MTEKYKWSISSVFLGAVFAFVACLMAVIMIIINVSWNKFKETAVTVPATITDIKSHRSGSAKHRRTVHDVYIQYEYQGESYDNKNDYYYSGMHKGETIDILINPDNPYELMSDPTAANVIVGIMCVIFGGVGVMVIAVEVKKSVYINRLIREGAYIFADYRMEVPGNMKVNNIRYNCSQFTYNDGFNELIFNSEPHHPNDCFYRPGDSVRVYVDLNGNRKLYYVSRESEKRSGF